MKFKLVSQKTKLSSKGGCPAFAALSFLGSASYILYKITKRDFERMKLIEKILKEKQIRNRCEDFCLDTMLLNES